MGDKFLYLFSIFKISETNFSFSSRFARFWRQISLSPLDYEILIMKFYFSSRFSRNFLFLLSIYEILFPVTSCAWIPAELLMCWTSEDFMKRIARIVLAIPASSSKSERVRFLFLLSKLWKGISDFTFSSRNWEKEIQISLSPLESVGRKFRFLFLLSKLGKGNSDFSVSSRNLWKENSDFSFSSRNCGKEIQISLSPLEIGEIVFKFLFLFSIWLFCLSSITGLRSDLIKS